jgi:hypothetical protein
VFGLAWSDSLRLLATCGTEQTLAIWNCWLPQPVAVLDAGIGSLIDVAFVDRADQLVALAPDWTVRVCVSIVSLPLWLIKLEWWVATLQALQPTPHDLCVRWPTIR